MYYGGYTLVALGAALGIIAMIGFPPRLLSVALEYPALAWIGRISYSLYLWHFPVFEGLKGSSIANQPLIFHSAQFAGAFALAIVSYYLVERPFLRMKNRIGEKAAPSAGVSASGLNRELIGEHGAQA
jgi:peptidoglycan/LPS O-acetylase OafA/YrhL